MATRSKIGIVTDEGIRCIYCHWDGYIEHNGRILFENYTTTEQVTALIDGGDLTTLAETLEDCEYYARDRGDPYEAVKPRMIPAGTGQRGFHTEDYAYLWNGSEWYVEEYCCAIKPLTPELWRGWEHD